MKLVFLANSNWFGFFSNVSRWSLHPVHAVVDAVTNLLIDKTNRTKPKENSNPSHTTF